MDDPLWLLTELVIVKSFRSPGARNNAGLDTETHCWSKPSQSLCSPKNHQLSNLKVISTTVHYFHHHHHHFHHLRQICQRPLAVDLIFTIGTISVAVANPVGGDAGASAALEIFRNHRFEK